MANSQLTTYTGKSFNRQSAKSALIEGESQIVATYANKPKAFDCYGYSITLQTVEEYLSSQQERLHEVLYRTLIYANGKSIAEIGVAFGSCLLPLTKKYKFEVTGYEIAENIPVYCSSLTENKVEVLPLNLYDNEPTPKVHDFLIFSEVLEHLFIDVNTVLERLSKFVRKDGHLLITTPNTYRAGNILRMLRGYNANERHPKLPQYNHNTVVDGRVHPREYTLFEIIHAIEESQEWKLVWYSTLPLKPPKTRSVIEKIKMAIVKHIFRFPLGTFIFCVAQRV
jgi:2-polyprenyl-3-methyl-5-hydroxy-6-metoxy-1,4-benzoquinol methylase